MVQNLPPDIFPHCEFFAKHQQLFDFKNFISQQAVYKNSSGSNTLAQHS